MKNIFLRRYIENIEKIYKEIFIIFTMKALSKEELEDYLEAERREIIKGYNKFNEETAKDFAKKRAESFHEEYFKEHHLN